MEPNQPDKPVTPNKLLQRAIARGKALAARAEGAPDFVVPGYFKSAAYKRQRAAKKKHAAAALKSYYKHRDKIRARARARYQMKVKGNAQ